MSPYVQQVEEGLYLLQYGDNAPKVARRVYGDVHKSNVLLQANQDPWDDLERILVPNKKGRTTVILSGETIQQTIRRMFPNQPTSFYIQPFYMWNGGEDARLKEGDLVFVPER